VLVVATTLAGYYMAAPHGLGWALLLHTLVGTPWSPVARRLQQLLEIEADGLMRRTRAVPAERRIAPGRAGLRLALSIIASPARDSGEPARRRRGVRHLLTYTVFYTR